ncbi:hypothetical protein D9Q98_003937 [Chlorella vulgaris]|uniref:Uncharacterized protein n=1 Tax=Chlorella vulgaris TaxID=3077 RepID=A0A9D4TQV8_CHLVU|nr:hypothetical protein D9Q98_003937 [Chlorella vulgaris]
MSTACLSTWLSILTCGLVRCGQQKEEQEHEAFAPLLGSPCKRGRYERFVQERDRRQGRERADTRQVLSAGYRNIGQDYTLTETLGQGAFGVVRLAVHVRTGLRYAVKTIDKAQLRRRVDVEDLRREVTILSQLSSHPNVAALLQTAEDERHVHIVIELCQGGELFERIARDSNLTERTAAHFFRMMVEVVRHAHALGICHRDIKPENFLMSDSTDNARVKACDFGLSQFYRPGRNFTSLVGSAFYVAPEVLLRNYGPPADVWSLGVCLYTLLSGLLPFHGETEEEVFQMVLHAELDLESSPWPSVSTHAKDLVRRMLQRDPARRPTPAEVLQHPWLCEASPDRPLHQVVARLAALNAKNKVVAASRLGREHIPSLHAMFHQLDADHDGQLNAEELQVALQRQGRHVTEDDARRMIAAADVDGDQQLGLAEFVAVSLASPLQRATFLRDLFEHFDSNNDQFVSKDELAQQLLGFAVSSEDIGEVLEKYADEDGRLNLQAFTRFMQQNTGSLQEAVRRRLPSLQPRVLKPNLQQRRQGRRQAAQVQATATSGGGVLQKLARVFKEKAQQDLSRIVKGTSKTREKLGVIEELFTYWNLDDADATLEELEDALIMSDFGPRTAFKVVDGIRDKVLAGKLKTGDQIRSELKAAITALLITRGGSTELALPAERPAVLLVVGVNGGGKTTTIGKLAHRFGSEGGARVVLAAGDTFRAAAAEQLEEWARRAGAEIVRAESDKTRPDTVLYQAVDSAVRSGADLVLCDTSGRLHTNWSLMDELAKCKRSIAKRLSGAPHEVLLVLDGTTGLNMLNQAKEFNETVQLTGLILTKLDGTARGGAVVSVVDELGVPVKFVGVGESISDLQPFDPATFVDALFPEVGSAVAAEAGGEASSQANAAP